MQTLTYNMSRWTTEELVDEVVRRTATDRPALEILEKVVLRARLAESDRRFEDGTQPALTVSQERVGVGGTLEMELARGEETAVAPVASHEVDSDTLDAHAHDHTHRKVSSAKFAAHLHHHLHLSDVEADGEFNGHTHARVHARHPWEPADPE
jgi:hypothetical protein